MKTFFYGPIYKSDKIEKKQSMIRQTDQRKYIRFQKNGRAHVKCTETRTDEDGNILECSYIAREDKHKQRKTPHVCSFQKNSHTNTISMYFCKEEVTKIDISPESVYSKMALLAGQMNLSLSFLSSVQFHEFVKFCMVAGNIALDQQNGDLFKQAESFVPAKQRGFFRNEMITTARSVHQMTMIEFKKLPYVAIAVDEGKDSVNKNLDFILENPNCRLEPYPYMTLKIENETAEGYAPLLAQGLANPSRYDINIGVVIADGNKAQKKCFSTDWEQSLRKTSPHSFIKSIIFVPCLCHKVNNALVHSFKNNEDIKSAINELRRIAKLCREHKDDVKALCPSHISTRLILDFDIANFIRTHAKRIEVFVPIPGEIPQLFPNLMILHNIVSHFESTRTLLSQAFPTLMNAFGAFDELSDEGNPYAQQFSASLKLKTFNCEEGGVWFLAYLLTRKGQRENRLSMLGQPMKQSHPFLNYFHIPPFAEAEDPLDHVIENDEADSDAEDNDPIDEDENEEATVEDDESEDLSPLLKKAKDFLRQQLINSCYSPVTIDHLMEHFNHYLDEEKPFEDCITNDVIGFSWLQIKAEYLEFKPIAEIAMKLHSSPCSEASCERTISTQKLILNLRRRNSANDLLEARLHLMRSKIKE